MYAVGITLLELVLHDAAYSATNLSQYETNGYYDIASIQSVVKTHPSHPLIACGNTSGRIVALMNNAN